MLFQNLPKPSNDTEIGMRIRYSSGVVPYRQVGNVVQVLLVKSTRNKAWVFPKGGCQPNLSKRENAIKEAYEEAGIIGETAEKLGDYEFVRDSVNQQVTLFYMKVVLEVNKYPEWKVRERKWFSVEQATVEAEYNLRWALEGLYQLQLDINKNVRRMKDFDKET